MPERYEKMMPTLVTDGNDPLAIEILPCSYARSMAKDGYPIWRADYPTVFEPGDEVTVKFTDDMLYVWVCDAKNPMRREMWWRGDAE